jgi:hypothetical protein
MSILLNDTSDVSPAGKEGSLTESCICLGTLVIAFQGLEYFRDILLFHGVCDMIKYEGQRECGDGICGLVRYVVNFMH